MRIVLDTNVVISALLWRGTPFLFLEAARSAIHVDLYASPVMLDELIDVLRRPMPTKRLALMGRTAPQVLAEYVDAIYFVSPIATPRIVADDPDDDHVIAAAVAANADLLVSGDRHLLLLKTHRSIRIVTPADAVAEIAAP